MEQPSIVFGMNTMFAVRQFLPEVLEMTRERGFRPVVLAPGAMAASELPSLIRHGVEFRSVPMRREISPLSDLRSLWRMWAILRSTRPAITNMSTPKMALLGGLAALLAGVPQRIYTMRGLRYETTRSWKRALLMACEKLACACAHRVICVSRSLKEAAVRDGICDPEKVALLGDRVSEGITVPRGASARAVSDVRRRVGIPEGTAVIGFVGRLTKDKGVHELVEAFRILRREGFAARLLLLGDFEAHDPVDDATARWIRCSPDAHWLGYVQEPRPYYELMDVFVLPTHREGLGRVLLEAAAAGKPVVSTLTTGVVDVVQDGVTGILVPAGDVQALARATATLLRDRELAGRMGKSARLLVEEHFDNTVYLERLGAMLESLAGGPAPVNGHGATEREVQGLRSIS